MPEHINPVTLHRRAEDPPDANFHNARHYEEREVIIKRNGSFRFFLSISGAVITILLATIAFFAGRDRVRVDNDLIRLDGIVVSQGITLAQHQEQLAVIKSRQERVLSDLVEIRETLQSNSDKLDKLLLEIKRKY
jgi:hypothetical protein